MQQDTPSRYMRWFGGLSIDWDGETISGVGNRKADALMLYLMSHPRPHPRETLAAMLWEDLPQDRALANLRLALTSLRKLFDEFIRADRKQIEWIGLMPTDVGYFVELCESFATSPQSSQALTPSQLKQLQTALGFYQGEFLAGFHIQQATTFMEWMEVERERLQQWAIKCGKLLLRGLLHQRQYAQGITWAQTILRWDELQEDVHEALIECLARSGQSDVALAQFQRVEALLDEELGVDPKESLLALQRRILHAQRRGNSELPNAPQQPKFIGRHAEQEQLRERLLDPSCRLLTLLGPGGIGKSSLAFHVLQELLDEGSLGFLCQIVAVPLDGVAGTAQLERALIDALQLQSPPDGKSQALLLDYLQDKEMVILLDGFELYIERGGASWLAEVLPQLPAITWLVTSREKLQIEQEWLLPLRGLGHTQDEESDEEPLSTSDEALALFVEAAKKHRPSGLTPEEKTWAKRLCQLVEGMPLAIQLAAAWLDHLSCQEIVEELTQSLDLLASRHKHASNPRHSSIRAIFANTWEQLSPTERDALCRMSMFARDFTWGAAQEITGASKDTLFALCDKQLIHRCHGSQQNGRYRLHDLMRQYTEEKKRELSVEVQFEQEEAYGAYYLRLLASARRPLQGTPPDQRPSQLELLELLDHEWEHIKQAWRWAIQRARMDLLISAGLGLYLYAMTRSRFAETYELLDEARRQLIDIPAPPGLDQTNALPPSLAIQMATLLLYTSSFAHSLLHNDDANHTLERAEGLLQSTPPSDNKAELTRFLHYLRFQYATRRGDDGQIELLTPKLEALLREDTEPWLHNASLCELAHEHARMGRYDLAQENHQRALSHGKKYHALLSQIIALDNLGGLEMIKGDLYTARTLFEQELGLARQMADREGIAFAMAQLARIHALQGEYSQAQSQAQEALLLAEELSSTDCLILTHQIHGEVSWAVGRYNAASTALAEAHQRQRQIGPGRDLLQIHKHQAMLCWSQGDLIRGREIVEMALADAKEQQLHDVIGQLHVVQGWIFRGLHMTQQAHQSFKAALDILEEHDNPLDLPLAYSGWGYTPDVTGSALDQAREHMGQGLSLAMTHQLWPQLCHVLYEYAALLLRATESRLEPLSWYQQILRHPAAWAITRREIHHELDTWMPSLTTAQHSELQQAAQQPMVATVERLTLARSPS